MTFDISPTLIENDIVRIAQDGNDVVLEHQPSGNELGRYNDTNGNWELGTNGPLGSVDVDNSFKVPVYSDNANAIQEDESMWYNDGSNQASGYYGYDGNSIIGPFRSGDVNNPLTGNLDADGNNIQNVGSLDTDAIDSSVTDPSDVSGSRSFSTEFENTDSTDRIVVITVESDGTQAVSLEMLIGNTSGSKVRVSTPRIQSDDLSGTTRVEYGPYRIPPGVFYEMNAFGGNAATIGEWREWNVA